VLNRPAEVANPDLGFGKRRRKLSKVMFLGLSDSFYERWQATRKPGRTGQPTEYRAAMAAVRLSEARKMGYRNKRYPLSHVER
jgi:hypothetical protein